MKDFHIKLSTIIDPIKGKVPAQLDYTGNDGLPYLSPEYLRKNIKPVFCKPSKNSVIVENGEVILLWDGSNAGEFFRAKSGVLASTMTALKLTDAYRSDYVYYSLKLLEYYLKAQTSGSGIPHVDKEVLGNLLISSFELSEQTAIAQILSTVDKAIEQTEAIIAKQQRIKTGLMQDLLTKGIDEHGNIRSEQTHKFKDSPLGRIPVEWDCPSINDIAIHVGSGVTPKGGESVYTKEGIIFIRSQNVSFQGLLLDDVAFIPFDIHKKMKRSQIYQFDILLNITGASIGRCCPVPVNFSEANVNQHVCAIRINNSDEFLATYISNVLESYIGQTQIEKFNAGGNREGLNYQQIRSFYVPMPPPNEIREISRQMKLMGKSISKGKNNLKKLDHLKTGLMQDLLTGKVRVSKELIEEINNKLNNKTNNN